MNALPNPIGSPAEPVSKRHSDNRHKWYLELLETCRALAGLPVLISLILEAITPDTKTIGIGAVIAVVIALVLHFFPKLRLMLKPRSGHAFWALAPWLLNAVLAGFLIFVVLPHRAIGQGQALASSWLKWQVDLEQASGKCAKATPKDETLWQRSSPDWLLNLIMNQGKTKEEVAKATKDRETAKAAAVEECMADKMQPVIGSRPRLAGDLTGLVSDLVAGQLVLADQNTRAVLQNRLSIGEKFLGSGRSEPVDANDYKDASVLEYLVPNLSDTSSNVWVWQLDNETRLDPTPITDRNLMKVLLTEPNYERVQHSDRAQQHSKFKDRWQVLKAHLQPNDTRPILVRFSPLPPNITYSGCLGRPPATRVFMSNLDELKERTVGEAAKSTGWSVSANLEEPGVKLFIWIYAPEYEGQAVPATWGNVLTNFGKWITAEPCKP
jgi:hypothetical protein